MRALIVVDVQNDFVDGSLAVPDARQVVEGVEWLAHQDYDAVFATRDWHPPDHGSFADEPEFRDGSWPPHCVRGTEGADFAWVMPDETNVTVISKGIGQEEAYSGFDDTELEEELHGRGVTGVDVVGLALDFCVAATALDAKRAGFDTAVLMGYTSAVGPGSGAEAVEALRAAGVTLIAEDELPDVVLDAMSPPPEGLLPPPRPR